MNTQFVIRKLLTDDPKRPDNRFVCDYVKGGYDYQVDGQGVAREKPYLPNIVMSGVDNEDGTATLTLQVQDWQNQDVEDAYLIRLWLSATALGAAADLGDIAATTGRIVVEETTDAVATIATDATGTAVLTLTVAENGTKYVHAAIIGKLEIGAIAVTGVS